MLNSNVRREHFFNIPLGPFAQLKAPSAEMHPSSTDVGISTYRFCVSAVLCRFAASIWRNAFFLS